MKKFFGVVIAVMLCMCMMVPAAFAAEETTTAIDVDAVVGGIADLIGGDTSDIFGDLNLGELDLGGLLGSFIEQEVTDDAVDPQVKVEQAIQDAGLGIDLTWLTTLLGEDVNADAINSFFAGFDSANMPDLLTVISEAFSAGGRGYDRRY